MELTEYGTIHIEKFYGSKISMLNRFDTFARRDGFKGNSLEEFEEWKKLSKHTLFKLLGMDRLIKCRQEAKVAERTELPGKIVREKVILKTEEDVEMTIDILIPPGEPKGVFLCLNGHQGGGRYSVAGYYDIPAIKEKIDFFNYDYGMKLCALGYVAVCPDCRGFGERRDEPLQDDEKQHFLTGSCRNLANMCLPMGIAVLGLLTWDNMRLIDYLYDRNEWDMSGLGCIGFSGGGMQTMYLCALDERIKQAVISGYFYGFRDSLMILNGNCACNYVPGLWEHFDCADILSLYAPKPVLIQSCREDHLNGPRGILNVSEQMDILKRAYALYGKEEYIKHDIREGGHHFHDESLKETLEEFYDKGRNQEAAR